MRDYTSNAKDRSRFITSYEKTDKNLIVYFADGKRRILSRNDYNEEIIDRKQKRQVEDGIARLKEFRSNRIGYMRLFNISLMLLGIGTLGIALGASSILVYGLVLASFASGLSFLSSYLKYRGIEKDIRKNRYFLRNEERINKNIRKNRNILANVSRNTVGLVRSTPRDASVVIKLNDVSRIPIKDFRNMVTEIKLSSDFGFRYDGEPVTNTGVVLSNDKPKTRVRRQSSTNRR